MGSLERSVLGFSKRAIWRCGASGRRRQELGKGRQGEESALRRWRSLQDGLAWSEYRNG